MIAPEEFYRGCLQNAGDAEKQGWLNKDWQAAGFKVLLDMVTARLPLSGLTIHDAGCGPGDLVPVLGAHGIASYIGTDLLPEMIEGARERHPGNDFRVLDLQREEPPQADVTFIFGTLAYQSPESVEEILTRLWGASNKALAFLTWWDMPTRIDPAREWWASQQRIKKFMRSVQATRVSKTNYGIPHEAAFVLFRD